MEELDPVRVLLFVTLRRRDLLPMRRIADELDGRGYETMLSGISDFLYAVQAFRPHVVVFGRCDHHFAHWLRAMSGCVVLSLNTEQGGHAEQAVVTQFVWGQADAGPPALESVDYHLLVDETTKRFLEPHIDPDRLVVVGYTRLLRSEPAAEPRPVSSPLVVGFAAGEAPRSIERLYEHFNVGLDLAQADLNHEQGHIAYNLLEWMWINRLVSDLRNRYECIVRIRQSDTRFLLDEAGVEIDRSEDPSEFFNRADVVVFGRSTIGVEALMAGVPTISISRFMEPLIESYRAPFISYVSLSWQPETFDEMDALLDRRQQSDLPLTPDDDSYLRFVTDTFYSGNLPDRSAQKIADVVDGAALEGEASLDLGRLFASVDAFSGLSRLMLRLAAQTSPRLIHRLVLLYLKVRRRYSTDTYLRAGVYIP